MNRNRNRNRKTLACGVVLAIAVVGQPKEAHARVDYSDSHTFEVPASLYDTPINEITFPGSHNSFNTSGTSPNCAPRSASNDSFLESAKAAGLKLTDYVRYVKVPKFNLFGVKIGFDTKAELKVGPADNKNVHHSITQQVVDKGLRFLEIDVYHASNGNWCVFHGKDGDATLDGNSFYLRSIIEEIAAAYKKIAPDPLFIKFAGGQLTESTLMEELQRVGLENDIFRAPSKSDNKSIPTINELSRMGKRLIIVSGPQGWRMKNAGTSPKHTSRTGCLDDVLDNPNNADFIRWNAFGLHDQFGFGSTNDADYIHARLIGHGIEKWVQGGHRINHLVVDFPNRVSAGMSAMRAANILNQVPSVKGTVTNGITGRLLKDVQFRVTMDNVNLSEDWYQSKGQPENQQPLISGKLAGLFDFPRPQEQALRIEPFKEGWRFEPTTIYITPFASAKSVSFRAYQDISPTSLAGRYTFVLQDGHVQLDPGLDVSNKQVFVKDINRLEHAAIVNKRSGLCVGVQGTHMYNGTPVTMQHCDGTDGQKWIYNPRTGHFKTKMGNFCLDGGGTANSGQEQKLWECVDHPNQRYTFAGQRIVPQSHQDSVGLDSQGSVPGAPLIIWNRYGDDNDDNRNWILERHYVVSSQGDNEVTDASRYNKGLKFFIVHDKEPRCLKADGDWHTAYIK